VHNVEIKGQAASGLSRLNAGLGAILTGDENDKLYWLQICEME
jgi:hypothetical protein